MCSKTYRVFSLLLLLSAFTTTSAFAQFETAPSNTTDSTHWNNTLDNGATTWLDPFGNPAASPPGSNAGGSASDDVIFSHHEAASGTQLYRVSSDVGQINNLEINGGTSTGNGGAGDHVQLQIRNGANLEVLGLSLIHI